MEIFFAKRITVLSLLLMCSYSLPNEPLTSVAYAAPPWTLKDYESGVGFLLSNPTDISRAGSALGDNSLRFNLAWAQIMKGLSDSDTDFDAKATNFESNLNSFFALVTASTDKSFEVILNSAVVRANFTTRPTVHFSLVDQKLVSVRGVLLESGSECLQYMEQPELTVEKRLVLKAIQFAKSQTTSTTRPLVFIQVDSAREFAILMTSVIGIPSTVHMIDSEGLRWSSRLLAAHSEIGSSGPPPTVLAHTSIHDQSLKVIAISDSTLVIETLSLDGVPVSVFNSSSFNNEQ